jgi:hypothetical protein
LLADAWLAAADRFEDALLFEAALWFAALPVDWFADCELLLPDA